VPGTPGTGQGSGGSSGQGLGAAGAGRGDVGNGNLTSPGDDYLERVRRRVAEFKRYPDAAKKQKQEGRGAISFRIARDGTVLDAWIERSTGFPLLDAAILQAVHEASPVPPVPERYRGAELTVSMPYAFSIGTFDRIFQ
jgi:protein TonB